MEPYGASSYYYFTRAVYRPKEGTAILLGGGLPCGPHMLRYSKTGMLARVAPYYTGWHSP